MTLEQRGARVMRVQRPAAMVARAAAAGLLATLVSLAACGEAEFTERFTTEHFVYYVEEGASPPCDATADWLERSYDANAKFFGATLRPGERIEYYLASSPETLGCSSRHAVACTQGAKDVVSTVRAQVPVHHHELVHANSLLLGEPPVLFMEGIAVVLSCSLGSDGDTTVDTSDPIELLVESEAFAWWLEEHDTSAYPASASFVRYLLDNFSQERFLSFYARAPLWGSRAEIDEVFRDEIGIGLDDAFADWRTRPPLHYGDLCLRIMDCDSSTPPLVDEDLAMGCGPTDNYGPFGVVEAIRRISVPENRTIHVTTETEVQPDAKAIPMAYLYGCGGGDAIGTSWLIGGYPGTTTGAVKRSLALDVPPGEYVAWFIASPGARVQLDVEERGSPMRDAACQPAEEPLPLDDEHETLLTSRWSERDCNGPWCPGKAWDVSIGGKGGALEVQPPPSLDERTPRELYICSEPCPQDSSSCEIVPIDVVNLQPVRSTQTFAPGTVLHLGAPAAPDADYFAVHLRVAPE